MPFTTSSVGEAATVDLVLVFDTSESMGKDTAGYDPRDFNPSGCNWSNTCQPLRQAKDAAKTLIRNLFNGYDQVAIVTGAQTRSEQHFLETVARNRGKKMRLFSNVEEALSWLGRS